MVVTSFNKLAHRGKLSFLRHIYNRKGIGVSVQPVLIDEVMSQLRHQDSLWRWSISVNER